MPKARSGNSPIPPAKLPELLALRQASEGMVGIAVDLLRACGRIDGLERVRFTSPHPAEFTDDVIEAMAQTPNVCPALHMPLQSGSDRVLRAMRRSYRAERYLGIIDRVRAAMPHAWILVPGYGSQGGTARDVAPAFDKNGLGAVINNSRGIIFAYKRKEYAERFAADQWQHAVAAATDDMIAQLRAEGIGAGPQ